MTGHSSPSHRKVTVTDIAAGCGVSRATVSLVLRHSPLVNKGTRARVEEELRRQGYVYNRAAANLRRQTSSSIALILNDLANPFFAEFAAGVDDVLGDAGYVTLLGSSAESPAREQLVLGSVMEHGPAGIILSPAENGDVVHVLSAVGATTPLVLFNRELSGVECAHWDRLMLDNARGARLVTEHLLAHGHRHIAFFGGNVASSSCRERREGYTDAMRAAGLTIAEQWQVECAPNRLSAAAATGKLFVNADARPTAAVCYNDAAALGLMLGLSQRGIQPGRDFAVTGFDDIAEAAVSVPALTTIAVSPRECGRHAAALVIRRIEDPTALPHRIIVPVQLQVRASSGAPLA